MPPHPGECTVRSPLSDGARFTALRLTGTKSVAFLLALVAVGAWAQNAPESATDRQIRTLQQRAKQQSGDYLVYDQLGQAYLQKTRETGDVAYFDLAEKALKKALDLVPQGAPQDFRAADPLVHMALVYMGEHNFMYSQKAIALGAGNLPAFAIEGDAYTDMGKYDDAAAAYDSLSALGRVVASPVTLAYMLDSRQAYLSFLHGDTDQAIELMKAAIGAGMQSNVPTENLAWLYFELGERYFQEGDLNHAAIAYQTGIAADPNHYRSLAGLGKVRAAQGKFDESIKLYQRSIDIIPFPQYVEELGDVYRRSGKQKEARQQYDLVEYIAHLSSLSQILANRELALFYADHDIKLPQALELARKELTVRSDIYTWDTLAWVLYKNGQLEEADKAMKKALQLKTNDSLLLFHAGMIDHALGRESTSADYLDRALKLNSHFHVLYDTVASRTLAELKNANQSALVGSK